MTELLTAAQMRAIEQAAIESGEVTGLELMERAGRGVVEAIFEEWPELAKSSYRAVVLCGPGNNGGDGFVVARLLKEWGWEVEVFLYGDEERLPADAAVNCARWREMGEVTSFDHCGASLPKAQVFIDALFGTGLSRPIGDELADLADVLLDELVEGVKAVSVDVPSGYCADSSKQLGDHVFEGCLTVTFHRPKIGHFLEPPAWNDKVVVKQIGVKKFDRFGDIELVRVLTGQGLSVVAIVELSKTSFDHKYAHGHALILSGGVGKGGAARLAARGALRIGAGVVTVGCPPSALIENAAQLNAIMLTSLKDEVVLAEVLEDTRINALCLGPGMGITPRAQALVDVALEAKRRVVLDADALTVLADDTTLFGKLHDKCVLTPHAGEFARLFPDIAEMLNAPATKGPAYSKVDATREAAKRAGCTVLFKGPDTVIAEPSGRCAINSAHYERAAPWLATAGSGDVLAGFITGLLARGFSPMQAAQTAAWLHVECARSFGPGLIAEDIPEELPKVLRKLEV